MLFADLLSLHLVTFLIFFILVRVSYSFSNQKPKGHIKRVFGYSYIGHVYNTWAKAVLWAHSSLPSTHDEFLMHKLSA